MDLQKPLAWRYATKFDPTKKIPKIQIDELLESLEDGARPLSVSSHGNFCDH